MFNLKAQQFRNDKPNNSNEIKLTSDSAAILKVGLEHTGIVFHIAHCKVTWGATYLIPRLFLR